MNNDLISRAALQAVFENECIGECGCCVHALELSNGCALIDDAPAVDAEPVRHGRWIETKMGFHCSNCKKKPGRHNSGHGANLTAYCPNCGAKMDEEV